MEFTEVLREHRTRRGVSQLDLALRAGTSQRHVSFVESGRSRAGRGMVLRLAESLGLPLRERNELLVLAGYAPVYPESRFDSAELGPVRAAMEHVLTGHLPFPAVVVDRYGDLVAANSSFALITGEDDPTGNGPTGKGPGEDGGRVAAELLEPPLNVYRLALHPRGLQPRIANFDIWAQHILEGLRQAALRDPGPGARPARLRAELAGYVPPRPPGADHLGFAVPLELHSPVGLLRLLTTVTTFATAVDVTVAELKLEAFLPADRATAEALTRWSEQRGTDVAGRTGVDSKDTVKRA